MPQSTAKPTASRKLPGKLIIQAGKWVWTTMWQIMMSQLAPRDRSGAYIRPASQFRDRISPDSSHPPEADRYSLIVGMGCPWAHRTLVVRALKGLETVISVAIAQPDPIAGGWVFEKEMEGCRTLAELYALAKSDYRGRSTVPVLWDRQKKAIVNNESAEIIVMLNAEFNEFAAHSAIDLYPDEGRESIDRWNEKIYHAVNNGVYRCGFAQTQTAYEQACNQLFETLDEIDAVLTENRYLCGDRVTLADVRLFTTLFRFDAVYFGLFKCNRRRIQDYVNLGAYLRDLYQLPGVAEICDLETVKRDYYGSLFPLNPGGIIPLGIEMNLSEPHDRSRLSQSFKPVDA
ncbi:MAG: glutathione S-transferase family protein [Leptolyngbyaceae cyanobacterium SM1_3_5]|nr:glutathione S-transferase family protein [Leptolyngbyaceae cyanobacterium SM1_3_5]